MTDMENLAGEQEGIIQACLICESEDVPGRTVEVAANCIGEFCEVCLALGVEYFGRQDRANDVLDVRSGQRELAKGISLGIRGLRNRIDALWDEKGDAEEPSVTRALVMALSRLRDACLQADGEGELSDHVDGSCLDAATAALTLATRGVAQVLNSPDPPEPLDATVGAEEWASPEPDDDPGDPFFTGLPPGVDLDGREGRED